MHQEGDFRNKKNATETEERKRTMTGKGTGQVTVIKREKAGESSPSLSYGFEGSFGC